MIEYINDDITKVDHGLVIHGTNCSGGFGSGVAGAIRKKWPIVYKRFVENGKGSHLLGTFDPVKIHDDLIVANCYTQLNFGSDGKVYASIDAVWTALHRAYYYAYNNCIESICMPKIGCGLGGLHWEYDGDEPGVKRYVAELCSRYDIIAKVYYID
jgi:O-acetyl-ADP-ribose deacetylase (regulator of RNase III)